MPQGHLGLAGIVSLRTTLRFCRSSTPYGKMEGGTPSLRRACTALSGRRASRPPEFRLAKLTRRPRRDHVGCQARTSPHGRLSGARSQLSNASRVAVATTNAPRPMPTTHEPDATMELWKLANPTWSCLSSLSMAATNSAFVTCVGSPLFIANLRLNASAACRCLLNDHITAAERSREKALALRSRMTVVVPALQERSF